MMRRLSTLLLIAVIAVAGWNFWQLERMREELRTIRAKVQMPDADASKASESTSDDSLLAALAAVKKHSQSARALMSKGDYKKARKELDESLRRLDHASQLSTELAADAENGLGKAWSRVRYQVKKAWKDISEDHEKGG